MIATTLNAITYSILFTSFVLQEKLVGRRAESRLSLFKTARARMAPAVAPATVLLVPSINFTCYRNVTRVVSWWIHRLGNATTHIEIFVHRQNNIRFHNRSFHVVRLRILKKAAPHRLAFSLQKLLLPVPAA